MALSLSVAVKAEILIKRETLMNRNCRKVLLHRGGDRVIPVAPLIHRDSDRGPCRCFGRNGISGSRFALEFASPIAPFTGQNQRIAGSDLWSTTVRAARPFPGWTPGVSLVSLVAH
jgi:hypothetical protein